MARVLEPLLWRRFSHQMASASTVEAEDIDLDLAANEGLLITGATCHSETEWVASTGDQHSVIVARPDADDAITTPTQMFNDTDTIATFHWNTAILTSGLVNVPHVIEWRPPGAEGGDGLVIARRMTWLMETSAANWLWNLTVWYKRLIFTNDEMLGLIIRRR